MARKGNQRKNGIAHNATVAEKKEKVQKAKNFDQEDYLDSNPSLEMLEKAKYTVDGQKNKQRPGSFDNNSMDHIGNGSLSHSSDPVDTPVSGLSSEHVIGNSGSKHIFAGWTVGASAFSILKMVVQWLERKKPLYDRMLTLLARLREYIRIKTEHLYPIVWKWVVHFGKLVLLLSMVWLDCSIRGLDSLLRLGTTSFFTVLWCSILSIIAMAGSFKFLLMLVISGCIALFIGFTLSIVVITIFSAVFLWMYGSFWTTGAVILVAGIAFGLSHERVALFVTTLYALYCAKTYVGWLGLFLGINLSFISSDLLIYFLKNNMNEHGPTNPSNRSDQTTHTSGAFFYGESNDAFQTAPRGPMDSESGSPSTSCADTDLTSEDEVLRLLNSCDHYSALGLSRFENIDTAYLKREYRKKAMLVHPDKNMGNEKAAEAFKKLQNAYEVLLDSVKRKAYDDELRREELLNYFRRFQDASQNRKPGFFASGFTHSEADGDPNGDSRRIACKKCQNFHTWVHVSRSKAQARWCQDCNDFHQAKDGDGWVEQSFQPLLFGLVRKADAPLVYVCADSRIYDATEWFVCQGMRCPANTHKPSFHVNTSLTSKNNGKANSSSHKGGPSVNVEEPMTEEEFFEWLHNAVRSGIFETKNNMDSESPAAKPGSAPKNNSGKKKRKGKKQW